MAPKQGQPDLGCWGIQGLGSGTLSHEACEQKSSASVSLSGIFSFQEADTGGNKAIWFIGSSVLIQCRALSRYSVNSYSINESDYM
jgi:hypothetical protein